MNRYVSYILQSKNLVSPIVTGVDCLWKIQTEMEIQSETKSLKKRAV